MKAAAPAFILLASAACAAVPPDEQNVPLHGDTGHHCEAGPAQSLIGRTATSELGAEALKLSGAGALRWIPEGSIVTMEFREDRLNVHLDRQNRVVRITCG